MWLGLPTIGVRHLLTRDELSSGKISILGQPTCYSDGVTLSQAMDLLDQDLQRFEQSINEYVTIDLRQHQFDALVSFAFNMGSMAFRTAHS